MDHFYTALGAFSSVIGEKMNTIIRKDMHDFHTVVVAVKGTDNHCNNNARQGGIQAQTTLPAAEQASPQRHISTYKKIAAIKAR